MPAPSEETEIDIVDDEDRPIGVMPRGLVRKAGANFRVAHVFVFDDHERLLLQQLGQVRTLQPGRWGSSVAAHLFASESAKDAAHRRLLEELAIDAPLDFLFKLAIREDRSLKFTYLFAARSNVATVQEPDHTAAIDFESLEWVGESIERRPDNFTDTFRLLFANFSSAPRRAGARGR